MPLFPFFMDISDKKCAVIGGGNIALGKIRALLPYGVKITVVSPEISQEIREIAGLELVCRKFKKKDLDGAFMLVAASSSAEANAEAARAARAAGVLVNSVDCPKDCGFMFPSLVRRSGVSIGISTGGRSPLLAAHIRRELEDVIPEFYGELADRLGEMRPAVREAAASQQERKRIFKLLLEHSLESGRLPEEGDILKAMEGADNTCD